MHSRPRRHGHAVRRHHPMLRPLPIRRPWSRGPPLLLPLLPPPHRSHCLQESSRQELLERRQPGCVYAIPSLYAVVVCLCPSAPPRSSHRCECGAIHPSERLSARRSLCHVPRCHRRLPATLLPQCPVVRYFLSVSPCVVRGLQCDTGPCLFVRRHRRRRPTRCIRLCLIDCTLSPRCRSRSWGYGSPLLALQVWSCQAPPVRIPRDSLSFSLCTHRHR
mmetsp:Transcript_57821/g.136248  ORF Transcript_57821/g.136248 Transcript_57821/m.136248 type:complete len:219 (+) Transcript_57821:254-910(+)